MKTITDNPFQQAEAPHQLRFSANTQQKNMAEGALEELAWSFSANHANEQATHWHIEALIDGSDIAEARLRIQLLQSQDTSFPDADISPLITQDWVAQVQEQFKPIHAGRFYVHGSHITTPPPQGSIPVLLDAGAAFGTGEHATTKGCLLMMDRMLKQRQYVRALDVGFGSAILTIALAKATQRHHYGTEIDAMSVKVAQENARLNAVDTQLTLRHGNGCFAPDIAKHYDLIIANILARPLMELAKDFRHALLPGGEIILSGLLNTQEEMVLWAFRQQGLFLKERLRLDGWSVLRLR